MLGSRNVHTPVIPSQVILLKYLCMCVVLITQHVAITHLGLPTRLLLGHSLFCICNLHLRLCLFWLKNTCISLGDYSFFRKCLSFTIILNNFTHCTVLDWQIFSFRSLLVSVSGEKLAAVLILFPLKLISFIGCLDLRSWSEVFFR